MNQLPASTTPLYAQIKAVISRRIQDAEWPANFQVPNETALAEEFDVSALTVRRALRELQAEGLLVRIQGRGTFVVGARTQCAIFDLPDISEEIEANGGVHTSEIIALEILPGDAPLARLLAVPHGTPVYYSRLLHKEDGTPVQLEDRFINAHEVPDYVRQDFTRVTPNAYLLRASEVTYVDNTIRAIRCDEESRRLLQIDENQACILLDRRTWREDVPVTRSRFIYPGDRYRLRSAHEALPSRAGIRTSPQANNPPRRIR